MADVELLPLPEMGHFEQRYAGIPYQVRTAYTADQMHAYARANMEPLLAEVERLRAEVARLEVIAGYGGVSSDAPERLILASEVYDGFQSCDKWCDVRRVVDDGQPMPESATVYVRADRADRLVEALEEIRSRSSINLVMRSDQFELAALLDDIHQIADDVLLWREASND